LPQWTDGASVPTGQRRKLAIISNFCIMSIYSFMVKVHKFVDIRPYFKLFQIDDNYCKDADAD